MATKSGGSASQITGYRYSMAVQMGIGRGPINELLEIRIGDLTAWSGSITGTTSADINQPNLFGGDQKEGGIVGTFYLLMGDAAQTVPSVILDNIEHANLGVPAWRGVTTLFYYGQISTNNPYPKPWKMRVRRSTAGWDNDSPWYPEKCPISMGSETATTVEFTSNPVGGDSITINGNTLAFQTLPLGANDIPIGDTVDASVANLVSKVNNGSFGTIAVADGTLIGFTSNPSVSTASGAFSVVTGGGQITAMNPAHIIYECATNNVWGRGLPASFIDDAAFRAAADTLNSEGFGLCLRWNRQDDIDRFVQTVVNHIGAVVYISRTTGLLTLKLIRDDYDPDSLTAFTFDNGLLDITDDQSSSNDTTYNEVIVKYTNPIVDKVGQIRVQNLASFQSLETLISTTVEYLGAPTAALAARLAQRDLQVNSSNLRRVTVKLDRAGWEISPGDVFKISAPTRGIESMILRAGNIEDGPLNDGTITITAIQDVFSTPTTTIVKPQESLWTPPDRAVIPIAEREISELTWFDLADNVPESTRSTIPADAGLIKAFAKKPNNAAIDYVVDTEADGESSFVERSIAGFDDETLLAADIGYYDTTITFLPNSILPIDVGIPIRIGDEYMRLDDIDIAFGTATVARGCIDTIPTPHTADDRIWFQTAAPATDFRDYTTGELVHVKLLTRTVSSKLNPVLAATDDITIEGRQGRPYPPGNFEINGHPFGDLDFAYTGVRIFVDPDFVLTWAHRDRIVEGNFLLEHGAGSTGPETGTTYTVRVYDGLTLLRTVTGISAATWTYTAAMAIADGDLHIYRFELESVRDGFVSWQHYNVTVERSPGFDDSFDDNFDGGPP